MDYVAKTSSLTKILSKYEGYKWGEGYDKAFNRLRHLLAKSLVLVPPNSKREFYVFIAIGGTSLGCCLA